MRFNKIGLFGLVILLLAALALPANAQLKRQAGTSTDIGITNSWYVFSANGYGTPVVKYVSVTSDLASSKLQYFTAGDPISVTASSAAGTTNIYCAGTNYFTAGDVIVVRSVANDTYQRCTVSTTAATYVTIPAGETLAFAIGAGDFLYKETATGAVPVGAATVTITGPSYSGVNGKPLLVQVTGTSACQINAIYAEFE